MFQLRTQPFHVRTVMGLNYVVEKSTGPVAYAANHDLLAACLCGRTGLYYTTLLLRLCASCCGRFLHAALLMLIREAHGTALKGFQWHCRHCSTATVLCYAIDITPSRARLICKGACRAYFLASSSTSRYV